MKKCLLILLNSFFKKDLELLYGEGSRVDITEIKMCTTTKKYLINCKLYVTNIELYGEIGNDGIIHLIKESWVYTGFDDNIVVSLSLDLI